MENSPLDLLPARRRLIAALGCGVALWVGVQIAAGPYVAVAVLTGLAYAASIGVNYRILALAVLALQTAAIIVPFFPGRPFAWEACAMVGWPSLVFAFLFNRNRAVLFRFEKPEVRALLALLGYVLILLVLMVTRGVGFRVLGGQQMGGRFYVQQVVLAIVPVLILTAAWRPQVVLGAVVTGWALSATYLVSDFALALGGPRFYPVLRFFELPTDAITFFLGAEISGVTRYQSLWFVGAALFSFLLLCIPLKDVLGRRWWQGVPLFCAAIGLELLSGHRTAFIRTVLVLSALSLIQRFWTPLRAVAIGLIIGPIAAGLYLAAPHLPDSIQRSISFLPGIQVSLEARHDAADTLRDRIEVLKLAVHDIPEYWLVGRGFSFDRSAAEFSPDGIERQYASGQFYNGFLGSLLKTGVPGLFCSLAFVFWVSRMALDVVRSLQQRAVSDWTLFERFSALICAQWFGIAVFFYCLHGDSAVWMQDFAAPAGLILYCRRQVLSE